MSMKKIGIIMHGATGRICSTQHIHNALIPIISEGGLHINNEIVVPRLLLVGRNKTELKKIADKNNIKGIRKAVIPNHILISKLDIYAPKPPIAF